MKTEKGRTIVAGGTNAICLDRQQVAFLIEDLESMLEVPDVKSVYVVTSEEEAVHEWFEKSDEERKATVTSLPPQPQQVYFGPVYALGFNTEVDDLK